MLISFAKILAYAFFAKTKEYASLVLWSPMKYL